MGGDLNLSSSLDPDALRSAFAVNRRLHIPGLLAQADADRLADRLEAERAWTTIVAAGGDYFEMPLDGRLAADPSKQSWLDAVAVDGRGRATQYVYDTRRPGGPDEANVVDQALAFLNGAPFLDLMRAVTGDDRIDFADAQASRYRPDHILTAHNDLSVGKNRLYAYVLNLTREWRADWGGTLVFYGDDGHVEQGWVPGFNALNLFAVPMGHAVTQVGAHAATDRLSIVGWLRSHTPVGPQTREEAVAASARPVV